MPKAMDPNARYRVVLKSDENKAPAPTFIYPFLVGRQQTRMMEIYNAINDGNDPVVNVQKTFEMASMFLVGWDNITDPATGEPIPFDPAKLADICSVLEAMELAQRVLFGQTLDTHDKKKLDLPSESGTADSAKIAEG